MQEDHTFPIPPPEFNGRSRIVPMDSPVLWFKQGWFLFAAQPGVWIASTAITLGTLFCLLLLPFVGKLIAVFLFPIFMAGFLFTCERLSTDKPPEVMDIFEGFRNNARLLLQLGTIYALIVAGAFVIIHLFGFPFFERFTIESSSAIIIITLGLLILVPLFLTILLIPLAIAICFAPALVFFNQLTPNVAIRASLNACLKNLLPCVLYSLMVLILAIFAALPAGLGFLILLPVLAGSVYAAYQDIFLAH